MISGIEDVPPVADENCCHCGIKLTDKNFQNWFAFVKVNGQMYQMPICENCNKKENTASAKAEE